MEMAKKKFTTARNEREKNADTENLVKTPTYVKFFTKPFDNVEQSTTTTAGERERGKLEKSRAAVLVTGSARLNVSVGRVHFSARQRVAVG